MKFIFVIGIEGAGHDMVRALLQPAIAHPEFVLCGKWRNVLVNHWDSRARYHKEFSFLSNLNRATVKEEFQAIIRKYRAEGKTHLMEDMSFPYHQPRNAMRRPDIIDFVDMVEGQADLKILMLYRNPVTATYSGLRRGFTKNVYEQARIIEDNLVYINQSLSVCGPDIFKILVFEDFLKAPKRYLPGLAAWLDLEEEILAKGIQNLREPHAPAAIPEKISKVLSGFFSKYRQQLWASLLLEEHRVLKK